MPSIDDIGAGLASRKPEKSAPPSIILRVAGAFAVGGLLVFGWHFVPAATPSTTVRNSSTPLGAEVKIAATSNRLGNASQAPLLRTCITSRVMSAGQTSYESRLGPRQRNPRNAPDLPYPGDPAKGYAMLQTADTAARAAALFNEPVGNGAVAELSSILGMIAECVFNKDAAELCDSNNRALAVDAVGRHVRHADSVLGQPNVTASLQISRLAALKERVIVGLRGHLRDGSLIAADFGMFAPGEVRRIARETKPIRDACATAAKNR
jgi:hypothetical protein